LLYKFIAAFGLVIFLNGCGFTPLMQGCGAKQKTELHISGQGYAAYKLRREMEKQLETLPEILPEKVIIRVNVSDAQSSTVTAVSANATRMMSTVAGGYTLAVNRQSIGGGTINSLTSYEVTARDEFISRTAQQAAINRTAFIVAEDIVREIAMKLRCKAKM
jgi:hypothetical protein